MKARLPILILFAASAACAEDITIKGITYEHVKWGTVTPATATFTHSRGVVTVPLEHLPTETRNMLGYDPQKAEHYKSIEKTASENYKKQQQILRDNREFEDWRSTHRIIDGKPIHTNQLTFVKLDGTIETRRGNLIMLKIPVRHVVARRTDYLASIGMFAGGKADVAPTTEIVGYKYAYILNSTNSDPIGSPAEISGVKVNPINNIDTYDAGVHPTRNHWKK